MAWRSNRFFIRSPGISAWWIAGSAISSSDVIVVTPNALSGRIVWGPGDPTAVAASFKILDQTMFLETPRSFGYEDLGDEPHPINPHSVTTRIETSAWEGTTGRTDVEFGTLSFHFRGKAIFE